MYGIKSLSVSANSGSKLSSAYTAAPLTYWSQTQTKDSFLLASKSGAFTLATVRSLYDASKLSPFDRVDSLLKYSRTNDSQQNNITVDMLL